MYSGRIMETGKTRDIYYQPFHPYTRALLKSTPSVEMKDKDLYVIPGSPPGNYEEIRGCVFASRCEFALDGCLTTIPELREISENHYSACLRMQDGTLPANSPEGGVK
jgi:oligopeptide/dipeptide ABC transporter ATP-binding protein